MADTPNKRRAKRLAKKKKRRSTMSRAARDGGGAAAPPSFKAGLTWPVGDCYLTSNWDKPGAAIQAVFVRSHDDGRSVAAFVDLDRSGPGVTGARVVTLHAAEAVVAECARISEEEDIAFHGAPATVVAGVLTDAHENTSPPLPDAWSRVAALMADVQPDALDVPFGPAPDEPDRPSGLLDRLFRFLG